MRNQDCKQFSSDASPAVRFVNNDIMNIASLSPHRIHRRERCHADDAPASVGCIASYKNESVRERVAELPAGDGVRRSGNLRQEAVEVSEVAGAHAPGFQELKADSMFHAAGDGICHPAGDLPQGETHDLFCEPSARAMGFEPTFSAVTGPRFKPLSYARAEGSTHEICYIKPSDLKRASFFEVLFFNSSSRLRASVFVANFSK